LILITNDGEFSQNIIHPSKKIEKEYLVGLEKDIKDIDIDNLLTGIELEDGLAKAKSVLKIGARKIKIVIEMGRKRVIRRMFKATGNKVITLERIRIGEIHLDVASGKFRELKASEIKEYV
jgi:23S rRNA pseudouridine2605 synthase